MKHKTQYIPRRQNKQMENKATLFPFLAVLLCTMGALVMLLVLIARNVQEGNAQETDAKPSNEVSRKDAEELLRQADEGIEEAQWFRENYELSKKEADEKLAESKTQLSVLEKETQKVQDEIDRLIRLGQELHQTDKIDESESAVLQKQLEQRKQMLEREALELAELQKKISEAAKSYSIIPYQGKSGTFRRPIYIECRDNKVIIQPEGVELTEADFQLAGRPDNPFDAVLRVIRQYYIETDQVVRGSEPYPLLIVRPSGTEAYGGVHQAIGNWVQDYGYELVNEDWNVEYPVPSVELKERMERQLEISRNRMFGYLTALKAAGAANNMQRQQRQYRLNPQGQVQAMNEDIPTFSRQRPEQRFGQRSEPYPEQHGNTPNAQPVAPDPNINLSTAEPQTSAGQWTAPYANAYPTGGNTGQNTGVADGVTENQSGNPSANQTGRQQQPAQTSQAGQNALSNVQVSPVVSEDGQSAAVAATWTPGLNKNNSNWALKEAKPFSAAVSRTIKIQCEAHQFVLLPQNGLQTGNVIPITGNSVAAVDQLVYAVWDFMESWGIAGEKMYWRPVLQIKVLPGGEQRFNELQYLLRNSGFVIEKI